MSEPGSKLDLNALGDALEVSGADENPTKEKEAEERARELMNKSNTLTATGAATKAGKDSPQTLSPQGSPEAAPQPLASNDTTSAIPPMSDAALDPTTQQIKSMFPDLEVDTIQAVVVAEDGDFERAINTLLQMSDPSYVPPPPAARRSSQTERDEQLARSLAQAEQQQFIPASGRASGGGLGSFFGLSGQSQQPPSQPHAQSYDPSNLAYQPRQRRTPSGQTPPQRPASGDNAGGRSQDQAGQQTGVGGSVGSYAPPSLPGPREAKQWQEDINKLAETGFAKAASTFSALRQRGEQAWASRAAQNGSPSGQTNGGGGVDASGQRGGSFFAGWNQRNAGVGSQSIVSPTIGSDRGFDRDPSPVGDNELAKILARGRSGGAEDGQRSQGRSNIGDRYKQVIANQRDNLKAKRSGSASKEDEAEEDDGDLGWDDAGRTSAKSKGKTEGDDGQTAFRPIKIADNSEPSMPNDTSITGQRNTVSLIDSTTTTKPSTAKQPHQEANDGDEDDDDDLEYVANPFEDDD